MVIANTTPAIIDNGKIVADGSTKKIIKSNKGDIHLQLEILGAKKEDIKFPQAMKKLKSYIAKALGHPNEKGGDVTYEEALKKTMIYVKK